MPSRIKGRRSGKVGVPYSLVRHTAGGDLSLFGTGADGDLIVSSGTTTISSSHKNYRRVHVAAGATLIIRGLRVRVQTEFRNDGTVHNDGGDASGETGGAGGTTTSPLLSGGNGATAGTNSRGKDSASSHIISADWVNLRQAGGPRGTTGNQPVASDSYSYGGYPAQTTDGTPVGGGGGSEGKNGTAGGCAGGGGGGPYDLYAPRFVGSGTFRSKGGNGTSGTTNGSGGGSGGGGHLRATGYEFASTLTWSAAAGTPGSQGSGSETGSPGQSGILEQILLAA